MLHSRKDYNEGKMDTIPKDEPVFLLRAQDKSAASVVRYWAQYQPLGELRDKALEHADLMDKWPVKKIADL